MPKGKGRATVTQLSYNTIFLWGSTCSFSLYPFSYLSQCWILVNHADPSLSYPIVGHDTHVLNIIHPPTHLSIHPFLLHSHLVLFALPTYCCSQKPNWIGWKALSYILHRSKGMCHSWCWALPSREDTYFESGQHVHLGPLYPLPSNFDPWQSYSLEVPIQILGVFEPRALTRRSKNTTHDKSYTKRGLVWVVIWRKKNFTHLH